MAWSFGDGFDCYTAVADAMNGYWDSWSVNGGVTLVAGRFAGSQALNWNLAAGAPNITKSSGQNDAVHQLVVAFRQSATITGTTLGFYMQLLDATTGQCCIVFRSDGAILLTSGTALGTVLATYTGAFTAINTWYSFEFEVVINNTTGSWTVRKNGNTSADFTATGLDTQVSANAYANKLTINQQAVLNAQQTDDLFWRSDATSVDWLGDIRCYTRMPATDASVQFSRIGTTPVQTAPTGTSVSAGASSTLGAGYFTRIDPAFSGVISFVTISSSSVTGNAKCCLFADNGGVPGAILQAATTPLALTGGNLVFSFSSPVTAIKGTFYWVGFAFDTNSLTITSSTTSQTQGGRQSAIAYSAFPQANPVVTVPSFGIQVMVTYGAGASWPLVAEAQQDAAATYVYDNVVGHADFYGVAPISSAAANTIAVTTRGYMQKSDAGNRTAAVQLKSGGTTVATPTLALSASGFQWLYRTDTTDPNTGAAWTAAAVNSAQIGPTIIS